MAFSIRQDPGLGRSGYRCEQRGLFSQSPDRRTGSADVAKDDGDEFRLTLLEREILSCPAMRKKKWGRFVGISSNMVGLAIPGMSHYIATKMGIIGFMRGLANDVASDGITANSVLPGLTNTLAIAPQSEEQKRGTWEQQAIKRLGEPEDVTGAVLFLTSDDAAFITGQAIVVDGGQYRLG